MVDSLGDTGHSRFLTPEMLKEEHEFAAGEFEGIGAEIELRDAHVVILAPLDNSPAQRAGLRPGDIILAADGLDMTGRPLTEVVSHISGPAGTSVTLTILDPATGQARDVTLTREKVKLQIVTWQQLPGTSVAHLRMSSFSQGAGNDLRDALQAIRDQNLSGIILDLRNNPGGLFDESIASASQFLAGGNVLQVRNAQGDIRAIAVKPGGVATDTPLAVIVNEGTASASEIVAGAIQDAHRGTIIGETTVGTGTVLSEFALSDGSAMLLATQEWLTPDGRVIWHKGIPPDQVVPLPLNATLLLPEAELGMTPEQFQASSDTQLLAALKALQPAAVPVAP